MHQSMHQIGGDEYAGKNSCTVGARISTATADPRLSTTGRSHGREANTAPSPLGPAKVVSTSAVTDGAAPGPFNGYSVVEADDLDAAVALVKDHPFVGRGGSLQVSMADLPQ